MAADADSGTQQLVAELRRIAQANGQRSVSRAQFIRATGLSYSYIRARCDSWTELVQAAGLEPIDTSRIDDDALFVAMCDAFVEAGGIVTQGRFRRVCRYSVNTHAKRFGRWENALVAFELGR